MICTPEATGFGGFQLKKQSIDYNVYALFNENIAGFS